MRGDQLTWHWDVPNSHPFADDIDYGFREGFAGSTKVKLESDAGRSAYETGQAARQELQDESRRFGELRVSVTGDDHVTYELTEQGEQ